jgi:hypothetical protein
LQSSSSVRKVGDYWLALLAAGLLLLPAGIIAFFLPQSGNGNGNGNGP